VVVVVSVVATRLVHIVQSYCLSVEWLVGVCN
jgi:hypothetical protein